MSSLFEKLSSNLLDLGARNKLLNFKDQKLKSLEIINPIANDVFKLLNEDKTLRFVRSDFEDVEDDSDEEENYDLSTVQELEKNEIVGYKRNQEYDRVLKYIKKFNDDVMTEKGISVLYMAFGLIKWTQASSSRYDLQSPIILIPVELIYNKFDQAYCVKRVEEEIIVNPALRSKFEADFGVALPDFEESDDFDTYFSKLLELAEENGWEMSDKVYIGIYSFAKLTMYKDLKTNEHLMEERPIINAIFKGKTEDFNSDITTNYDEYFENGEELKLSNVVDADSSQIKAIQEAKNGKSIVIQGPPGTGKSQTITNIIAELLHDGKNVLFVSEKISALNVVYNNLKRVGLESFCLQLHSDKTKKKDFVQELYTILQNPPRGEKKRDESIQELLKYKNELDTYCRLIYKSIPVIELTPYDIISRINSFEEVHLNYKIEDINNKNLEYLGHITILLEKYATYTGGLADNYWKSPWYGFNGDKYLYSEESRLKSLLSDAANYVDELSKNTKQLNKLVDFNLDSISDIENLKTELEAFSNLTVPDIHLFNVEQGKKILTLLKQYSSLFDDYKNELKKLEGVFDKGFYKLDIFDLYKKFNGEYNTAFRIFNKNYKSDISLLRSFNKTTSKPTYQFLKEHINVAYKVSEAEKELDDIKNSLTELTDYDYLSSTDLNGVINNIEQYLSKQSLQIQFKSDFSEKTFETAKEVTRDLLNKTSDLEIVKRVQTYFDTEVFNIFEASLDVVLTKLQDCYKEFDELMDWIRFYSLFSELKNQNILPFIEECLSNGISIDKLPNAFSYLFYTAWMMYIYYLEPTLSTFRRNNQDLYVKKYMELDRKGFREAESAIRARHREEIRILKDTVYYFPQNPISRQVSIINHEANKKRAIKPIRYLLRDAKDVIKILKPCFLMSPLSVATYLEYNPNSFDVVIFDEASQIFPWDAIGAISRSKQVIVVGDSKQMPPTNFFMASTGDYDEEDYDAYEDENASDYESILDLCSAVLPHTLLNWHYRSRSEALIAFSNHYFYGDRLVTFPSQHVQTEDLGINYYYVKDATFINRTNRKEADMVVDLIYDHFNRHPERSLGVVCFSINQQALLEDVLEERRRSDDRYARYFEKSVKEPFFIKNLETVQGDERDTIIFSVGYGKDSAGNLKHNFGPLNRLGGERRLNVAVTRAKYNVKLVSSIHSFDIDLSRTKAEGARLLKEYLDIAENGLARLNREIKVNSNAEADSPFEEEVAGFIRSEGYEVDLQVGCSGFRIDLCVKHPKHNDYVLAIECDGATYHSSKNTRDRDRLRQEILERLGWKFYRIWSTDWFINLRSEKEHLVAAIKTAIDEFDSKLKAEEEKRQKETEERFAEVIKKEEKEKEKQRVDELPFTAKLTEQEKIVIMTVNDHLARCNHKFMKADRSKLYSYRVYEDVQNGLVHYWFWFAKNGKDLVFKYRRTPNDEEIVKTVLGNKATYVISIIDLLLQKRYSSQGEPIKRNVQLKLDFEEDDEFNQKNEDNLMIYYSIIKTLRGKVSYYSPKEREVVLKIADFVNDTICKDAIDKKYFKNKEEFEKFKNSRRITYNFFGTNFNLGSVTIQQAKTFYVYYKASCLITKIQEYEKIFKTNIITDHLELINSLVDLIKHHDYSFSKAKGVNSNFSYVSDGVLEDVLNQFKPFE